MNRARFARCVLALLVCTSGCQLVGVVADKMAGHAEVPAQYEPVKTEPLLVIAEDYRQQTLSRADADRLAKFVGDELAREKVAPIIAQERILAARDEHPDYARMSVVDVARAVGAKQVIYIDLTGVGVGAQAGTDLLKGIANAKVSVIDVEAGRAVFPGESGGVAVNYTSPMRRNGDRANPDSVRAETIAGLGDRIARLFYKWKPADTELPESDI